MTERFRKQLLLVVASLVATTAGLQATPAEDEDALFRIWLSAFAEMKRGDQQAEVDHWPKAIAKYRIALKEFEALSADFPDYQKEIVAYRIDHVNEQIRFASETLRNQNPVAADRFEKAVAHADLAKQMESAEQWEEAYRMASRSVHRLKSLALENPDFYADMVSEEYIELEELIGRLRTHILTFADGRSVISNLELELSRELPDIDGSSLPDRPDILMSPALFPSANG